MINDKLRNVLNNNMMKRLLPLLLLFTLLLAIPAYAQDDSTDITHIEVALWPDFDDASLLVLATGTMPEDAELPATITFPLPEGYNRLVVARVTDDNNMIDDLETIETPTSVTFDISESRFRIEYYVPYTANGDQRELDFSWLSPDLNVGILQIIVQRPAAASEMTITPASVGEVADSNTGLTEYLLPETNVPADTAYDVTAAYTVNSRLLSVDILNDSTLPTADNSAPTNTEETAVSEPAATNNNTLILIFGIIGVLLVAVAVGWYIFSSRPASKPPQRSKSTHSKKKRAAASSGFCHECGSPLTPKAKFCASCGTAVKKK